MERSGFAKLRMWSVPNRKFLRDFFLNLCVQILCIAAAQKRYFTDQHLLRTHLFFVTETSELRLAGLMI